MAEAVVNESEFNRRHNEQGKPRKDREIFSIWVALVFIAVIGAHFMLNVAPSTPTGYVTAVQDAPDNLGLLVYSFSVLGIEVLVGGLAYFGITRHVK